MILARKPIFWAVFFGHFTVDLFNGSVAVLVTFLAGYLLDLSNTQIGFAISAYQLASAVSQPVFGWRADRHGGRWYGAGGVAWVVLLLVITLIIATTTRSYPLMLIALILGAFGSAAFRPVGAMHAADSDQTRAKSNLSLFFFAGQLGGGLGPAITGMLLDRAATHNYIFTSAFPALSGALVERGSIAPMLAFALFAVPSVILMGLIIPSAQAFVAARERTAASTKKNEHRPLTRLAIGTLILVVVLRSFVNPGSVSFLPRLFQLRGWTAAEYGLITSAYWIGGGFMGILFGVLADRFGSRLLIAASMFLSAPAVLGLSLFEGGIGFLFALLVGAFSGGSHSLIVAMAHQILPSGKGLASGASLGLIFGTGAIGVLVIGGVADSFSLPTAFQMIAVSTLLAGIVALLLPEDRPGQATPAVDTGEQVVGALSSGD